MDHAICLNRKWGTKVNKEVMFWPFVVNGVLKTRQIFLENEFLEQLPWNFKCFLCHLFNLKLFYMNLYENISIVKWRVFNIKRGCIVNFRIVIKRALPIGFGWSSAVDLLFFPQRIWAALCLNVLFSKITSWKKKKLYWIVSDKKAYL